MFGVDRFDQPRFSRLQEFTDDRHVVPTRLGNPEGGGHVDTEHVTGWRDSKLTLARRQHVPGLVFLLGFQGVLVIWAAISARAYAAVGAGEAVVTASSAVSGPSTGLEMPAAECPNAFFAAFKSTCLRVNSWKNRSPTG